MRATAIAGGPKSFTISARRSLIGLRSAVRQHQTRPSRSNHAWLRGRHAIETKDVSATGNRYSTQAIKATTADKGKGEI